MVKENKPHSIHLRLTDEQYSFCDDIASSLGVGVSDFIRMSLNAIMVTSNKVQNKVQLGNLGENYENNENYKQHIV